MKEETVGTDWHRDSMLRLYRTGLRDLLRRRIGARAYHCAESGSRGIDVSFDVDARRGQLQLAYNALPLPDGSGVFTIGARRLVVVPEAESDDLEGGRVRCAGDQLLAFLSDKIGGDPASMDWDEETALCLVPLERLITGFLESVGQDLEAANPYAIVTHLRRVLIPRGRALLPDSHIGRLCPVDVQGAPDRPATILTLSRGARIVGDRIVVVSRDPADRLGPVAASIPFVHHTDPMRAQIGANLMRQWRAAARPEPALVQTGLEPDDERLWIGCNLLTAFACHGKDTYEDSLLLSESAAARLGFDTESGIGALLSNRSGQKGVVGTVLPDRDMPHLADGTAVELVVSFLALHTRMNTGQLLEAVAGWIARRAGAPYVAAPFADSEGLRNALPDTPYRQRLHLGDGREAETESIVGWVYWGIRGGHASDRLRVSGAIGEGRYMRQGVMENQVLMNRGAYRTIQERLTSLASEEDTEPGWSVLYGNLRRKLRAAGIRAEMGDSGLTFSLAEFEDDTLRLAFPLMHPWLPGHTIRRVGIVPDVEGFADLEKANRTLMEGRPVPASLRQGRAEHLQALLDRYFDGLLSTMDARIGNRPRRSGMGMLSVGTDLSYDEVGIPRRMAEALFAGSSPEWVVINRAPTMENTAIVAFHPIVVTGDAVRLNPYVCRWMNADFDGDQVAVFVPGSPETQEEAGRLLSVLGHVKADPATLDTLAPRGEALWGLARLWLSSEGRRRIAEVLPAVGKDGDLPTRRSLVRALRELREAEGEATAVEKAVEMWDLGFLAALRSGATLDPFLTPAFRFPGAPSGLDSKAWERHREHCIQILAVTKDYADPAMGAQLLAVHSGARGEEGNILDLMQGSGLVEDESGRRRTVAPGFLAGMSFDAYAAHATVDHERMAEAAVWAGGPSPAFPDYRPYRPEGRHVIARAMRSEFPGIVFARAAETGETDPLEDADTRLFVGLLPRR